MQREDVRNLLQSDSLDRGYLERWAHALGVEQAYRETGG